MKILIACNRDSYKNPFVSTLADGLLAQGIDVTCSIDEFWHNWKEYDIIHLQWPNLLVAGLTTIEPLQKHLQSIKDAGKPIVVTCHNLHPHYNKQEVINQAYDVVYGACDCIIHLGEYSQQLLQKEYPNAKHVLIPHHIYDTLYTSMPTREEAIKYLHLDVSKRYVLCFGAFRDDEERELVRKAAEYFQNEGFRILAPGFSRCKSTGGVRLIVKSYCEYILRKLKYRKVLFGSNYISDKVLPYYYAVSDIAFIQRKKILNSGNVPLAMMMGLVVLGPAVGNVGTILSLCNNPTFELDDEIQLSVRIHDAVVLTKKGLGEKNREYAITNFSTEIVSKAYSVLYNEILD